MKRPVNLILVFLLTAESQAQHIANGKMAAKDQFPFFAQLELTKPVEKSNQRVSENACGATLVHPQWLLTAAHCFSHLHKATLRRLTMSGFLEVYMGTILRFDAKGQKNSVKQIYIHPEYDESLSPQGMLTTAKNDVALVALRKPYTVSKSVKLIKLPYSTRSGRKVPKRCQVGTIIGIGRIKYDVHIVMFAKVHSVAFDELHVTLPAPLSNNSFYTESLWNEIRPLSGDYGGPFVCFPHGEPVQYGIISRYINVSGLVVVVYEEVGKHIKFIQKHVPQTSSVRIEPIESRTASRSAGSRWIALFPRTVFIYLSFTMYLDIGIKYVSVP